MILLVDGYNLYYSGMHPKEAHPELEQARDAVTTLVRRHCLAHDWRAVIFWDGGPQGEFLPRVEFREGVEVRYSPPTSDADTEIKKFISAHPGGERDQLRLISSDREIQRFAATYHVPWTTAHGFLVEVEQAAVDKDAPPADEPVEKYKGTPGDDVNYWLRVFAPDAKKKPKSS